MITALWGVVVVSVTVVVASGLLILVNRAIPTELREEHNNVAGFIYAVVGIVYAVLLAFVVIAAWEDYETARTTMVREADELAEIYSIAHELPEPDRSELRGLVRSYIQVVIEEEWPLMQEGRESARAWETLEGIRATIQSFEPRGEAEQVLYAEELDRVSALGDARRERLLAVGEGIPNILWVVLVVGGVITVSFTFLFGLKSNWAHTAMVAALTAILTMVLYTIGVLEYPFSGGAGLDPYPFELVLERFDDSNL